MSNSADNATGGGYGTLADSIGRISPGFALGRVFGRLLWSIATVLDATREFVEQGVRARMPGVGTKEALPAIGNDRLIDRGPTETEDAYAHRLSGAFDTWANAGGPYALLENLMAFFSPRPLSIYLVSDRSKWHWSLPDSPSTVLRQRGDDSGAANWHWDPESLISPHRYWRGWVILDASDGRWTQWHIGDGAIIGDGHTIGSSATAEEVASVRRIVRRFKGAHAWVVNIIVTFTPDLFSPHNAPGSGDMPDHNYDQLDERSNNAIYWIGVSTP